MSDRATTLPSLVRHLRSESLVSCEDRQLLERYASLGDEAAFTVLLERHGPMVAGLCRRWLHDAHLADDVFQATFLVLARSAATIRRRDSLPSWLYGVARRLCRNARLAEQARLRREQHAAQDRSRRAPPGHGWEEVQLALDEELQRLPECYRAPLLLCYLQGRTQDEAASHLGWSLSTFRRRLENARELLRTRLVRRGVAPGTGLCAVALADPVLGAGLRQAALATVLADRRGESVAAAVRLLAGGGMGRLAPWTLFCLVMATAVAMAGISWSARRPEPPVRAAPAPTGATAHRDEPLPQGAQLRLGTLALRHGRISWGGSLTYDAAGKHLVSAGGGWVRRWKAATGESLLALGDGGRSAPYVGTTLVRGDGLAARMGDHGLTGRGWWSREYDLTTGKLRGGVSLAFPRTDQAHALPTILSPDGKTYAELNHAGTLTLWNAATGSVVHILKPDRGQYTAVAFPPGGKTVLAGDDNHLFRLFDLATGALLRSFGATEKGHVVGRMAVSPDGKWLATAGGQRGSNPAIWPHDRFIGLWDLEGGHHRRTLSFPEDYGANSLVFAPDSRTLLAGLRGGEKGSPAAVRTWDVKTGQAGRAWISDPTLGLILAVRPDGKELATMNENGVIRLWYRATGKETTPVAGCPCGLSAVQFSADGRSLRTAGSDLSLDEWDATTGRRTRSFPARARGFSPTFSPDGRYLATWFWDTGQRTVFRLHEVPGGKQVRDHEGASPVFSRDGRLLAIQDKEWRIRVHDLATGKVVHTLTPPGGDRKGNWVHPVPRGFSPDGRRLIVQGEMLSTWDLRSGKLVSSWDLIEREVIHKGKSERHSWERLESVAVSPDGTRVAFGLLKDQERKEGSRDWFGQVLVFETATGKSLFRVDLQGESPEQMAFSADGRRLAAAGMWTVRVWDVTTGEKAGTFQGHRGKVTALAFHPDGRRLASASEDTTVLIWGVPAK